MTESFVDILAETEESTAPEPEPKRKRRPRVGKLQSRSDILAEARKVYSEVRRGTISASAGKSQVEILGHLFRMFRDAGSSNLADGADLDQLRDASDELAEVEAFEREEERKKQADDQPAQPEKGIPDEFQD